MKPQIEIHSQCDYSNITSGPTSKKNQIKRERYALFRENEIENQNMMLLEKLYSILSINTHSKAKKEQKSLNYPSRKKELGRINLENRSLYKSLVDVKPTVNLQKISKWSDSMQKYGRNISSSCKRKDAFRPILTQGVVRAYPEIRARTSYATARIRTLSMQVPSFDHFANLLNPE